MRSVIQCAGIADIVNKYDTFIVDQWGVLHDGLSGFSDAKQSLRYLKTRGKAVAVLTNSGKSSENNLHRRSGRSNYPVRLDTLPSEERYPLGLWTAPNPLLCRASHLIGIFRCWSRTQKQSMKSHFLQ
jgi:hypothetical protein